MRRLFCAVFVVACVPVCAAAATAATFATDIPFRHCDGLICIDAALDGDKPRTLILDTGDVASTLITDVAKPLGWTLEAAKQSDGTVMPGIFRGGEHRVGLGRLEAKEKFLVFDRTRLGEHVPPADGSITYDFFKDRILQIDYPQQRLRVSDVITTPVNAGAHSAGTLQLITFGKQGPPIVVGSGFIVNGKPLRAQIDTAYTGSLLVYDSAVASLGLTKQGKSTYFGYTDGGVNMLAAPARSIGFGEHIIEKNPTMYFVGAGKNPVHQPDSLFEATVGNALFAHSVVTLDFHAMTLDVQPAR